MQHCTLATDEEEEEDEDGEIADDEEDEDDDDDGGEEAGRDDGVETADDRGFSTEVNRRHVTEHCSIVCAAMGNAFVGQKPVIGMATHDPPGSYTQHSRLGLGAADVVGAKDAAKDDIREDIAGEDGAEEGRRDEGAADDTGNDVFPCDEALLLPNKYCQFTCPCSMLVPANAVTAVTVKTAAPSLASDPSDRRCVCIGGST